MSTRKTKEVAPMKAKKEPQKTKLERQYAENFLYADPVYSIESGSLEQPSPLKYFPSVTTYGAYEKPI